MGGEARGGGRTKFIVGVGVDGTAHAVVVVVEPSAPFCLPVRRRAVCPRADVPVAVQHVLPDTCRQAHAPNKKKNGKRLPCGRGRAAAWGRGRRTAACRAGGAPSSMAYAALPSSSTSRTARIMSQWSGEGRVE